MSSRPLYCPRCQKVHYFQRDVQAEPNAETWGAVLRRSWPEIIGGTLVFLSLFLGLPFLLWLVAG